MEATKAKKTETTAIDSINLTIEQMEVIKHILGHAYESMRWYNEDLDPKNRVWETSNYADKLKLTNQQFIDLNKILKIIF
jgi:ribulose bisphosphate carboxylase small subunit